LQVYFRAAEIAQSPLGHVHEQAPKSLTPVIRVDREVVDPASVAFVANHDRSDQLAALFEQEKVSRLWPTCGHIPVGLFHGRVSSQIDQSDTSASWSPGRYDRSTGHENCLPVRVRFSAAC